MSTSTRVAGFVLGVLAVFTVAWGLGYAVGPLGGEPAEQAHHETGAGSHGDHTAEEVALPGGLAVSEDGHSLRLASVIAEPGRGVPLSFTIDGPDGHAVTDFEVEHEKRLHLIVVRRDLTGFQHVHPVMASDGSWAVDVDLAPGVWRVFTDFTPAGAEGLTLGADLSVAGDYVPAATEPETTTATVDGYTVTVEGDLVPGEASPLTLTVEKDGEPVTDLQPYLGAHGHLVALREGDLAYLHVHPEDTADAGPEIGFVAEVPTAGGYRLYLDFRHDDVVRTAELVVTAHAEEGHDDH